MAANNPRKFEEKIAQHKLRQAQETKEFDMIMQEMSRVTVSNDFVRMTCCFAILFTREFPRSYIHRRKWVARNKLGTDMAAPCPTSTLLKIKQLDL